MKFRSMILVGLTIGIVVLIALKTLGTLDTKGKPAPAPSQVSAIERAKEQGQPVWLLFHSTTCASCIEMEKICQALKPEFKGKVAFININVNNPNEKQLLEQFKITSIPTTYFLNVRGKIIFQSVGVIPMADMRLKLNQLAEGQ
ncbi:thiol:disulfide interchange protein DsbD [Peptococcaceae bacterium CEB3]|nr:thiol:disulfide interchange protein DsbD [Peptococcaceae bacterium CEB3]